MTGTAAVAIAGLLLLPRNAPGSRAIVVVREENYFIFHVKPPVLPAGHRMGFVIGIFLTVWLYLPLKSIAAESVVARS